MDAVDEVDETIDALQRHYRAALTTWEVGFLASLLQQRRAGRRLTDKQRETLDRIFERVSAGGSRSRAEDD